MEFYSAHVIHLKTAKFNQNIPLQLDLFYLNVFLSCSTENSSTL